MDIRSTLLTALQDIRKLTVANREAALFGTSKVLTNTTAPCKLLGSRTGSASERSVTNA